MLDPMSRDVDNWLDDLGLGQYADVFAKNDVDLRALPLLTGEDLKELGVSLGHRRILLDAIGRLSGAKAAGSETGRDLPDEPEGNTPTEPPDAGAFDAPSGQDTAAAAAERRHLTVLFADLVGSTEMTNRFDPEEMRALLQRYQDTVAGEVSRYGGYVAKYLGDGLLIFFGWPRAYEDHAYRAIKSGLEALRRVQNITAPDGQPLAARIGVASGLVVVGDIVGENTREEGAITGPVINLAARIQEHTPPNSLVLPQDEAEAALGRIFEFSPLGEISLKGFSRPRALVKVEREREAESRFRAQHQPDQRGSMVGRLHEKGLLEQAWQHARAGRGEVVLLIGEAGIGKSRLTEEFLVEDVDSSATDIIRLNCVPYLASSPFHPVAERIARDAGIQPSDTDNAMLARVRALLESRAGVDVDHMLPVYAALVAPGSAEARAILALSPQEQRELTTGALIDVIKARAAVKPVLLLVEDAHWLDPSSKALLDRIVAICSDLPLMVLITHRPEWSHDWPEGEAQIQTLRLRRFDVEQVADLIEQVSGKTPDDNLVEQIVAKTDGVPLFIEEVTRAIFAGGQEAGGVPSSLQGVLMARLDAVSENAKQVALTASVMGREFEPELLRIAMGRSAEDTADSLEELRRSGLLFESGHNRGHFVFRHALIRDTAYQSMLSTTRKAQHAGVARALLAVRRADIERQPELVAHHLTEAGDHAQAYDCWKAASEKALSRNATEEAVANSTEMLKAAELLGRPDGEEIIAAQILVGRSYEAIGRLPESIAILIDSCTQAKAAAKPELFADAAFYLTEAGLLAHEHLDMANALCQEALAGLPEADEARRCRIMSQLARSMMHAGEFAESVGYSGKALSLAQRLGDIKAQFSVHMARFFVPAVARTDEEVRDWRKRLQQLQALAEKLGNLDRGRDRAISLFVSAEMGDRGQWEYYLGLLSEVADADRHPQLFWVETHAHAMMAILDGDFDSAERFANKALKIGRRTHGQHVEGVFGVQMFTIRREQARLGEVAPVIRKLIDDNPDDMTWKPGFGVIASELGYTEAAERILHEVAATGFDLPLDAIYSTTLSYLADICIAVGNEAHAQTIYELLAPYAELTITAGVTTVCNGAAGRKLGGLAALLGDWNRAETHFETALKLDQAMRARPWITHSKADYATALRRRGRREDAEHALVLEAEALEICQELGMISLGARLMDHVN
ncbi:AAA family ATPase [Primorskyibacter sp. S87]|uniref:AAA family ATPase n=1 Tax=Primorskyibacter sp. S87 TaxID=3415126 RepID=UPI003C7D052A